MRNQSGVTPLRSFVLFTLALLFIAIPVSSLAITDVIRPASTYKADGILVKFKSATSRSSRMNTFSTAGCRETGKFRIVPGLSHARVLSGQTMEDTLRSLRDNPQVQYAEPNYIYTIQQTIPDDPDFSQLYALNNTGQNGGTANADIDAPEAWDLQTGSHDVIIAVIDSGVDYTHDELKNNMWVNTAEIPDNGIDDDGNGYIDDYRGWDFANNDNDPMDDHYHGTHVAGTIAAAGNNGIGVTGINWHARIMPLKFITATGSGSVESAIAAIEYAVAMGAKISSNSWGGPQYSQALKDAIANAERMGHLFIAAAANDSVDNDTAPRYPASYDLPNIISVAATDNNDALASFSNYGLTTVDLGAPGVNIYSTSPGNGYRTLSGTSMATPHVSGVAGLLLAQNPGLSYQEIKDLILSNTDPVASLKGKTVTGGRLNAYKALKALAGQINITPVKATLAAGTTQAFSATGGSAPYVWSVSDTSLASIDSATGLLTATAAGTVQVQVTDSAGESGSTGDITITQTTVTPANLIIAVGQNAQFNASGGTPPYSWSVSDASIASINASGLLSGLSAGTVQVTASDANGIANTTGNIDVVNSTLSVTPASAVFGTNTQAQFTVSGGTPPYSWSSLDTTVASIDNSGLLSTKSVGTTVISVRDAAGAIGLSDIIEVRHIQVEPQTAVIQTSQTQQFTATGGREPYVWSVSDDTIASIDSSGLLTGVGGGTVTVTATDADGATGNSGSITVQSNSFPTISPVYPTVSVGQTVQFKAVGGTPPYSWSTGNFFVASINASTGLATGVRPSTTFITVRDKNGRSDSTLITVRSIGISPSTGNIAVGDTLQFTVSGGTSPYRWSVSDTRLASVSSNGLLTALAAGSVIVTATDIFGASASSGFINISGSTTPPSPGLNVSPKTAVLTPGKSLTFSASGGLAPYRWSSSNPAVASINSSGTLTAVSAGSTIVTVTDAAGTTASTDSIQVRQLSITPTTGNINVGATLQFTASGGTAPYSWRVSNSFLASISSSGLLTGVAAGTVTVTATDADGLTATSGAITISGSTTAPHIEPATANLNVGETLNFTLVGATGGVYWSVSNLAVARIIANTGQLTAVAPGVTRVSAFDSSGKFYSSGDITVSGGALPARLTLTPQTASIKVGETLQFTAEGGTPPYLWRTTNPFIASVNGSGLLTGITSGVVFVTVSDSRGQSASTSLILVNSTSTGSTGSTGLNVTPTSAIVPRGGWMQFSVSGGNGPYTWSVSNPVVGTVNSIGFFQASFLVTGTTTITVKDYFGKTITTGTIEVR